MGYLPERIDDSAGTCAVSNASLIVRHISYRGAESPARTDAVERVTQAAILTKILGLP